MIKYLLDDTICALATASGTGGVALIRVSGKNAWNFTKNICTKKFKQGVDSHRVYFTNLKDPNTNNTIDEALITYFAKGKSFTGEETVEISCHGSPLIVQEILQALVASGCRVAERGEFTYRAFMNQRIDLAQAESVLSLIESKSKMARQISLRQLKGSISKQVDRIEDALTFVLANLEASIDFSTEDIEVMDYTKSIELLSSCEQELKIILKSYEQGKIIRDGFYVAIVGKPNVGKSSLLNALIEQDKAIVSDEAGTTRDLVEAEIFINGYRIKLIDTAGIHDTENKIERLGMDRSKNAMLEADLILYLISPDETKLDNEILSGLHSKTYEVWQSKADLGATTTLTDKRVSSYTESGLEQLKNSLAEKVKVSFNEDAAIVYQARHFELFTIILQRLEKAQKMIKSNASQEFIALELQEALGACFEILGKRFDDEVMDRVFREFCLGK